MSAMIAQQDNGRIHNGAVLQTGNGQTYNSPAEIRPPLRKVASSRGLAMVQIFFGALLMLLEIIGLGIGIGAIDIVSQVGSGIWTGIIFIVTGSLGVAATRTPTLNVDRNCLFICFLVFSVISSVLAMGMFIFSVIVLMSANSLTYMCDGSFVYDHYVCGNYKQIGQTFLGVRITSVIVYFALFIFSTVTAAFGCCNVCRSSPRVVTTTIYAPQPYHPLQQAQYYGPPQGNQTSVNYEYLYRGGPPIFQGGTGIHVVGGHMDLPPNYEEHRA